MRILAFTLLLTSSLAWGATPRELTTPPVARAIIAQDKTLAGITAMQKYWEGLAYRTGSIIHYCDCGTGAEGDCVAGANGNAGTSASPKQTINDAISTLNSTANGNTVALCKGGAFTPTNDSSLETLLNITRTACVDGAPCVDLREYSPSTFTGTAKPIINNPGRVASVRNLFHISGTGEGGIRFLNLRLIGDNGTLGNRNTAFIFTTGARDIVIGNVDMEDFDVAINNTGAHITYGHNYNITATGNTFTDCRTWGYTGASVTADISYNYFETCGSSTVYDHAIYVAGATEVTDNKLNGNYVNRQWGSTCYGAPIVVHGAFDRFEVIGNVVAVTASEATNGCWGMGVNNVTGDTTPMYYKNTTISNNVIINGGNLGLSVTTCPSCVIENNLVLMNWAGGDLRGIITGYQAAKVGNGDEINNSNTVRNNTVWFGPNTLNNSDGIEVNTEGTGHIVANNSVYSTSLGTGLDCYSYPLSAASYSYINYNHCHNATAHEWEDGTGNLAAWQAASTFDDNSITTAPSFTNTTTYDFHPATGSPLIGAGTNTHKSTKDLIGKTRPNPPAIGAQEP